MPKMPVESHELLDNKTLKEWTGAGFTDAVAAMNCSKCGAQYGTDCRTPKGRKAWPPHGERTAALFNTTYNANLLPILKFPNV